MLSNPLLAALFTATLSPASVSRSATPATLPPHRPKMVVPESVHDFGTVPKGPDLFWEYEVRNEGTDFLDLQLVRVGGTAFFATVPPGEFVCVPLRVETKNFSGPISKSVTLVSNDLGIDDPPPLRR